jgi:APA family basic amino acid/polyamine antiporter
LSTAATVLGLIRLRLREGKQLHVPGWPWAPGLFVLGVLLMTTLAFVQITLPAWKKLLQSGAPSG